MGCSQLKVQPNATPAPVRATNQEKPMNFDQPWDQVETKKAPATNTKNNFHKDFEKESDLDELLDKEPLILTKSSKPIPASYKSTLDSNKKNKSKNQYRIQLLTVADIESAQQKKNQFAYLIGEYVEIYFDAPFYKLRFGHFDSQRAAEEKLLDLLDLGLNGFVIKDK